MTILCNSVCRNALIAVMLVGATPALAQTAAPGALTQPSQSAPGGPTSTVAPDPDSATDIIVTANKRAENVQDVPLAVSVLQPAQLQAAGVREFQDLGRVAPSLVVRPAEHPVNANVSLRGVGTFAFGIGVEPSVAVLVDEVPLAFQARAFSDLPDVERIEVLRGPQSTLYGKAASAGLINIITRNPTPTFHARANALVTSDQEYGGNFSLSGPISPELGYVFSGSYNYYDGNVRNVFNGKDVNGRRTFNTRGKLRWKPSDDIAITLSANYLNGKTDVGRPFIRVAPNALFRNTAGLTPAVVFPGFTPSTQNDKISNNYNARTNYEGYGGYLRGEFGLGDLTLVSITSYDKFQLNDFLDQDDTALTVPIGSNVQIGTFNSKLVTQELRLQSPGDKPFRYTIGAYFAKVDFNRPFYRGPAFSLANWYATSASRQLAGFVQADWEFLPKATLTGGLRVQNEKINYTFRDIQNGNAFFSGGAEDTAETHRVSLRYEFTPDVSVFGTYSTGYKGQTYDLTTGFNANRALAGPIKPETSRDFELGLRTQFLNRRVTLNATVFDTNFTNLQAQGIETLPDGTQNFRLANVGKLNTRGVEVESTARIGHDVSINAAATYLDARIKSFPVAQCYIGQTAAQGCTGTPARQNLAGARAAQAPEWKLSAGADYSPAIGDTLRGVAQINWQYTSTVNYSLSQDPETIQKAYSIFNIGLGIRDANRRWELVGFVNNLFDKQYFPALVNTAGNFGGAQATQAILPRDFRRYGGVRLALNF
ncbi:TonB-dependent receptor [Sphingomonas sp. 10B4]|uniref:TonB-dependent receptor n=2 Tax=Sphingomonas sp. 10B4 TaxID=3048575 RepID=UPI002B2339F7|nr:TonB-dependent receptor [Sphingomonas sp. 10B4]